MDLIPYPFWLNECFDAILTNYHMTDYRIYLYQHPFSSCHDDFGEEIVENVQIPPPRAATIEERKHYLARIRQFERSLCISRETQRIVFRLIIWMEKHP